MKRDNLSFGKMFGEMLKPFKNGVNIRTNIAIFKPTH